MSDPLDSQDDPAEKRPPGERTALPPVVHQSQDLLQGRKEALIDHEGVKYRLRLTSGGKLYLTK